MFFGLDQLRDSLDDLASVMIVSWCGMVVFAAIVGRAIAKRTLRPVADAARVATAISDGDLDARLGTEGNDEFGDLAKSFNHMADAVRTSIGELEAAAERERRFTADVAHELRTPLTGLWASTSLIAERVDELPPTMRQPLQLVTTDVERFRALVLELLELAQLDSPTDEPVVEELALDRAVNAVLAAMPSDRRAAVDVDVDGEFRICRPPAVPPDTRQPDRQCDRSRRRARVDHGIGVRSRNCGRSRRRRRWHPARGARPDLRAIPQIRAIAGTRWIGTRTRDRATTRPKPRRRNRCLSRTRWGNSVHGPSPASAPCRPQSAGAVHRLARNQERWCSALNARRDPSGSP